MRPLIRATDPPRAILAADPTCRRLSEREQAVVLLVGEGLPDDVIAHRLSLAPSTVAAYIRHARVRLELDSRRALAAWVNARRAANGRLHRVKVDAGLANR